MEYFTHTDTELQYGYPDVPMYKLNNKTGVLGMHVDERDVEHLNDRLQWAFEEDCGLFLPVISPTSPFRNVQRIEAIAYTNVAHTIGTLPPQIRYQPLKDIIRFGGRGPDSRATIVQVLSLDLPGLVAAHDASQRIARLREQRAAGI